MKKQFHKNKAQLLKDKENEKEVLRQREKIKNELYPFLLETSNNVEDAKIFCQSLAVVIRQKMSRLLENKVLKDLELSTMINSTLKAEEKMRWERILKMFEDEKLKTSLDILEGMSDEIDLFIREENQKRPLKDLKATFL